MGEILVNDLTYSLNAAITSTSATTLTVASPTGIGAAPATGNFRIRIDNELLLVTGISGTTWTVTRGIEGTTAATHSSASTIYLTLTAGALNTKGSENRNIGTMPTRGEGLLISNGWIEGSTKGNECRMHLFVSADEGKSWNTLVPRYVYKDNVDTNDYFAPSTGQLRDCSLFRYGNKYYSAYTNDPGGLGGMFSIAVATDLMTWAKLMDVSLTSVAGADSARAPEFFLDDDGTVRIFFSISPGGAVNDQLYEMHATAADLTSWSTPVKITGTSLSTWTIDPFVVKIGGTYNIFCKDANTNRVVLYTSTSVTSGYVVTNSGITPGSGANYEAPSVVQLDATTWRMFVDHRTDQGINYIDSSDGFATWTAPVEVVAPYRWQHGTVIKVLDISTFRHVASAAIQGHRPLGSQTTPSTFSVVSDGWRTISYSGVLRDELKAWHSSNAALLTAPFSGWYTFIGYAIFPSNATGRRTLRVQVNDTEISNLNTATAEPSASSLTVTGVCWADIGDQFTLNAYQNSGVTLSCTNCTLTVVSLGGY